jgi:hypothetical protein
MKKGISNNQKQPKKPLSPPPGDQSRHNCHTDHSHQHTPAKNNLLNFFECCLTDDPAPLSPKILQARENLQDQAFEPVEISSENTFQVTSDMIVADLLFNFPLLRGYLENLHPLGLMSPALDRISLELFFSDLDKNIDQICQEMTDLINQSRT